MALLDGMWEKGEEGGGREEVGGEGAGCGMKKKWKCMGGGEGRREEEKRDTEMEDSEA